MAFCTYRGHQIHLIPHGIDWKIHISWLGGHCCQESEDYRFDDKDAAFVRACELIDKELEGK